jgi:uncharacterized integral membrane protein
VSEDFEREPAVGGDPSHFAPGVGAHEADPVAAAMTREPSEGPAPRATNAGRVWIAIAVAIVLLVLLIIFIAENSNSVTISFLGAHGHISLALALLIAAVVGALVTLLAGTARILQLRLEVRRRHDGGVRPRRHRLAPH